MQELKDLVQMAKECGIVALHLGKRAHISEVNDNDSTPGEIKRMVKFAMKHVNYQGSMTGETITGIALLDGEELPTARGGGVSKDGTVLLNYLKMKVVFSLFAELYQTEELGPVLAIIPACTKAETMVHMMNKRVAAFLFYFDAALPVKFIMDLLRATCDATLVAEIKDCDWDLDTQTQTTPQEKKEDKGIDKLENAEWYKNAFNLQSLGKATKPMVNKDPEALFNLDANNSVLHCRCHRQCHCAAAATVTAAALQPLHCHCCLRCSCGCAAAADAAALSCAAAALSLPPPTPMLLCCHCHCHCCCTATATLPLLPVLQLQLQLPLRLPPMPTPLH